MATDPSTDLAALVDQRRADADAIAEQARVGVDREPIPVFMWETVDDEYIRVPQGDDRERWLADYRERRDAALQSTAKLDAQVADFERATELERAEKWTPDVRAALHRMVRLRSPI